jgi:hypothetical protein
MRAKRASSPLSHRLFQELATAAVSRGYITVSHRATMMDNAGGIGMDDAGGIGKPSIVKSHFP